MIDKKVIEKNFSKYAKFYDRYADIQSLCAQELMTNVIGKSFKNILDIGCGTGNFTKILRQTFPDSQIKAIDISKNMVALAQDKLKDKNIEFIVLDAEDIETDAKFDLISSNVSFQWFQNLPESLKIYKNMLEEGGEIIFSTFGPLTFSELGKCLKNSFGGENSLSATEFISFKNLKRTMESIFKEVDIKEKSYKKEYKSLPDLLKNIKYTGAKGRGLIEKNVWTYKTIDRIEKLYIDNFGKIESTYQVFFCKGKK